MSARRDVGEALRHAAALLRKGEPLPPDYAAGLADRLARVADVLLDRDNKEPAAVVEALGAGAKRGRPPSAGKAARDAELVEAVAAKVRTGKLRQNGAILEVAEERNKRAAGMREMFGTSSEVEAVARGVEVTDRTVRRAVEDRRRKR